MSRVPEVCCRLCLACELTPPYICLPEEADLAADIGAALALQTRLQDPALFPHHVCSACRAVLVPFLRLRRLARRQERFLLRHQARIKQFGLESVRGGEGAGWGEEEGEDEEERVEEPCGICVPSRPSKRSSLAHHQRVFHKDKSIGCEIPDCKVKFKKRSDMKKHIRNVHNNEKSLCVQCGDSFKDLNYHMKVFHENVQYPCEMCSKVYTSKQGLNFHLKHSHGDRKKEVCHICAVEVKHVRHHIKMKHSGMVEKTASCQDENCDRKFRTRQEATIHHNSAHLNKKEVCPLCGGLFKNLYTHIHQTHQNEKKHVCDQCGKAFGKKNDLKIHKDRIHLLKRYICPKCGKAISKIREHLKTVHNVTQVNMDEMEDTQPNVGQEQEPPSPPARQEQGPPGPGQERDLLGPPPGQEQGPPGPPPGPGQEQGLPGPPSVQEQGPPGPPPGQEQAPPGSGQEQGPSGPPSVQKQGLPGPGQEQAPLGSGQEQGPLVHLSGQEQGPPGPSHAVECLPGGGGLAQGWPL